MCLPSGVGRATPHGLPSPLPYLRPRSTGEAGLQGRAAAVYDDGLVEIAHVARPCPLPVPLALVFVSCSVSPRIPTLLLSAWRLACFLCRSPVGGFIVLSVYFCNDTPAYPHRDLDQLIGFVLSHRAFIVKIVADQLLQPPPLGPRSRTSPSLSQTTFVEPHQHLSSRKSWPTNLTSAAAPRAEPLFPKNKRAFN